MNTYFLFAPRRRFAAEVRVLAGMRSVFLRVQLAGLGLSLSPRLFARCLDSRVLLQQLSREALERSLGGEPGLQCLCGTWDVRRL